MQLSIKNKLVLAIGLIILVITGLQVWYNTGQLRGEIQQMTWSFIKESSNSNVRGISRWLDARINMVTATEEAFTQADEPISHLAQSMTAGHFDLIYAGTQDGRMIQSKPTNLPADYDPRQRPWYKDAMAAGKLVITAPYADASSGQMIITIAEPFARGNTQGVIAGDISIDGLVQDVLAMNAQGSSTVEIRNMIETLQRNTQGAVNTMQEGQLLAQHSVTDANDATQALELITASINQISDMATQISGAAEEQRAVTDEVSRNIQAVKDVADELTLDAGNSRQNAVQLKNIAGALNHQVGMFRI